MEYLHFAIKNFKGIQSLRFELSQKPHAPIFLLVGLNESGKTTILEALSFFYETIVMEKELTARPDVRVDVHTLIPKSQKDNFNSDISIEAGFALGDSDEQEIAKLLSSKGYISHHIERRFTVSVSLSFKNSNHEKTSTSWVPNITYRETSDSAVKQLSPDDAAPWAEAWKLINQLIPPLIYYPNFLFDFPNRIYLQKMADEDTHNKEQGFYRRVVQDVLDSLENGLTIDTHIVGRAESKEAKDREALESVINKVGAQLTRKILNTEYSVFGEESRHREILVTPPRKDDTTPWSVELKIKEGQDNYFVSEKSLGFRWFFTFLLFTQFRLSRKTRSSNIYFMFDEPASNLHQSAQARLLIALDSLTTKQNVSVIYTTHSHHLIDPRWLENAYIVRNEALDYEKDELFSNFITNITIERYRVFVNKYPEKRNYYQPILDVLEYRPSNLEMAYDAIFVEGKNDFYTTQFFNSIYFSDLGLHVMPGEGSGSLSTVIKLYLGWGRKFIAVLDSDQAGEDSRKRYIEAFGQIVEDRIFTLANVEHLWTNFQMESLISKADRKRILEIVFPTDPKYTKKKLNLAIQELLMNKRKLTLERQTLDNFKALFDFLAREINK